MSFVESVEEDATHFFGDLKSVDCYNRDLLGVSVSNKRIDDDVLGVS